jgi:formylmethanofuran dehydrogenase subunit E
LKNGVKVYKEDVEKTEAPSLFFHPSSTVKKVELFIEPVIEQPKPEEDDKEEFSSDDVEAEIVADEEKTSTSQDFVCPKCGKVYKSQSAFERHILVCKG